MTQPTAISNEVGVRTWPATRNNESAPFWRRAGHRPASDGLVASARPAFTLIELLVVILVVAILSALLLVAVDSVRRSARSVQCLSNLRQLALVFRSYADAHNGRFPSGDAELWFVQIARHGELPQAVFQCPDDPDVQPISCEWRDDTLTVPPASLAGKRIEIVANSDLILVFDPAPGWHSPDYVNAATVGGTARPYTTDEFQENLLRSVTSGQAFYLDD
jgi:prepilin-type N-terminal cleavage/methylation domain-containing protein